MKYQVSSIKYSHEKPAKAKIRALVLGPFVSFFVQFRVSQFIDSSSF